MTVCAILTYLFFFYCSGDHRDLHSFPTRRSSDLIQSVDRKLSFEDIAKAKGLDMDSLLKEMEQIVYSGTKLNADYWIEEYLDEDQQEEVFDYFMSAENDSIEAALEEFDGDYDIEELRLMRIKFISEVAN